MASNPNKFIVTRMAALMVAAAALGGCVQRTISITSEPTGALVYLNDEEIGRTPVTVPFRFYGTYDVRLEKDGCSPLWTKAEARQPVWEYMGPDLVAEAIPGAKSRVKWHFKLESAPPPDSDRLIDHARQMRAAAQTQPAP